MVRRTRVLALVAALFVGVPAALTTAEAAPVVTEGTTTTYTFNYSGSSELFTVPDGVTQIVVEAFGGGGGTSDGAKVGGGGAAARGTLTVAQGQSLQINVGGRG